MLSAHAIVTGTGELMARPYAVCEPAGQRIALVGLSRRGGTAGIGALQPFAQLLPIDS